MSETKDANAMVLSREQTKDEHFLTVLGLNKHKGHINLNFWYNGKIVLSTRVDAVTFKDYTLDEPKETKIA